MVLENQNISQTVIKFNQDSCIIVCTYLIFISRLDAGTFGTMGVGLGFAIAASVLVKYKDEDLDPPASRVVCIQGDSAFGFSGMELETVFRFVFFLILSATTNSMVDTRFNAKYSFIFSNLCLSNSCYYPNTLYSPFIISKRML